jgi:hypothetical protein
MPGWHISVPNPAGSVSSKSKIKDIIIITDEKNATIHNLGWKRFNSV